MDVELYNYVDMAFKDYHAGRLNMENLLKEKRKLQKEEEEGRIGNKLNAGVVFLPKASAPPGVEFLRDNADVMNNFFIDIAARSFTDVEEVLQNQRENQEAQKTKEALAELAKVSGAWSSEILGEAATQLGQLDKTATTHLQANNLLEGEKADLGATITTTPGYPTTR